jgi:hypothetical protein
MLTLPQFGVATSHEEYQCHHSLCLGYRSLSSVSTVLVHIKLPLNLP